MTKNLQSILLVALVLCLVSFNATAQETSQRGNAFDQPEEEENLNRELWESIKKTPYDDVLKYVAQAQAQSKQSTEVVLPNGWRIAPAGTQTGLGRLPYEAVNFAGRLVALDTGYYDKKKEPQEVSIVDTSSGQIVKTLQFDSLFPSAQAGLDGDLYISGGFEQKIYRLDKEFKTVREYNVGGYAAGLAGVDAQHLAVAYLTTTNQAGEYSEGKLALLNTETGKIEKEARAGYFPYAIRFLNNKLYVTLLGENKLTIFDAQLNPIKTLDTGRTPQEMCSDNERLYVVNTGSDEVSVIDTRTDAVSSVINLRARNNRFGLAPSSCAIDGTRLYITLANTNSVAVFDKNRQVQIGQIPTGWYPTKVLFNDSQLLVLNAKGIRPRRPNPNQLLPSSVKPGSSYVLTLLQGSLSIIPREQLKTNLSTWTQQVASGSPIYTSARNFNPPIRHIFYIIKENRTYDQILGDLGRGNGDASLTLFGRNVTPNHHALAEKFVTLDNFYADGEISVLGHSFTTSGYASPFLEWLGNNGYAGRYKGYPYGTVPAVFSPAYVWDALDEKNVSYRIYGENYYLFTRLYRLIAENFGAENELTRKYYARTMTLAAKTDRGKAFYELAKDHYEQTKTVGDIARLLEDEKFTNGLSQIFTGDDSLAQSLKTNRAFRQQFAVFLSRYAFNYSSWNLNVSDLERAQNWKLDFQRQLRNNNVEQFQYLWLPNDHTDGDSTKIRSASEFVAQNDAALGYIVETISHSPVWRNSLILVEEDDAQNGPDHVDATRTVALVASPYVKRGAVISDRYDQLSMLRTVGLLLGINSLNLNERMAVPMFSIFTTRPNFTPYTAVPRSPALKDVDAQIYKQLTTANHR